MGNFRKVWARRRVCTKEVSGMVWVCGRQLEVDGRCSRIEHGSKLEPTMG